MTFAEFESEMRRLTSQFGKPAYGEERTRLFFEAVQHLSHAWWAKTVDKFIGEFARPPLMPELRAEVAIERERNWDRERAVERKESIEFMRSFGNGDLQAICRAIKKRVEGELPDEQFNNLIQNLEKLPADNGS